ncbi:hypothetical protein [Parapedobacter tibetensis]|uniref:hypothetical protein n=1 Tax=Parapedobacter tibetensis TaxID=2972951 RepID=UPI00214D7BCA|nr:hypothetical protein [Parapedobacter tibetensis]
MSHLKKWNHKKPQPLLLGWKYPSSAKGLGKFNVKTPNQPFYYFMLVFSFIFLYLSTMQPFHSVVSVADFFSVCMPFGTV